MQHSTLHTYLGGHSGTRRADRPRTRPGLCRACRRVIDRGRLSGPFRTALHPAARVPHPEVVAAGSGCCGGEIRIHAHGREIDDGVMTTKRAPPQSRLRRPLIVFFALTFLFGWGALASLIAFGGLMEPVFGPPDGQPWENYVFTLVAVVMVIWKRDHFFSRDGAVTDVVLRPR